MNAKRLGDGDDQAKRLEQLRAQQAAAKKAQQKQNKPPLEKIAGAAKDLAAQKSEHAKTGLTSFGAGLVSGQVEKALNAKELDAVNQAHLAAQLEGIDPKILDKLISEANAQDDKAQVAFAKALATDVRIDEIKDDDLPALAKEIREKDPGLVAKLYQRGDGSTDDIIRKFHSSDEDF